jgi:hypothetical protein
MYCAFPEGTCGQNASGKCTPLPQKCGLTFSTVCGCDGKVYGSACEAAVAGISVVGAGACIGSPCSGQPPDPAAACAGNGFCEFPPGSCGDQGQVGTCTSRPQACVQPDATVCGCNGMTYSNDCSAYAAGFSVRHTASCP